MIKRHLCLFGGVTAVSNQTFLYFTAEQDELSRGGPALRPVGPVVRQRAPDQPVCPQRVAGPHLQCLRPGLEPAGLQVSSTLCTGLPFTASFYSSAARVPPPHRGSESQLWPREGAVTSLREPHIVSPPLHPLVLRQPSLLSRRLREKHTLVRAHTRNYLNFNLLLIMLQSRLLPVQSAVVPTCV